MGDIWNKITKILYTLNKGDGVLTQSRISGFQLCISISVKLAMQSIQFIPTVISISIKSVISTPYNTTLEPSPGVNTSWFHKLCQSWKKLQMSALQKAEIAKGKGQLWDKKEKEIKK